MALSVCCCAGGVSTASDDGTATWSATVMRHIADAEYHVSRRESATPGGIGEAWQAPNRAQGFRTYFAAEGIRVVPREPDEDPAWSLGLSLARCGRDGVMDYVKAPRETRADGSRLEFDRGAIVEWYVNDRSGLEQGFTLRERPAGGSAARPLHVEIELSGSLVPRFSGDGQAVDFVDARHGIVLRYAQLLVVDAAENPLPARFDGFTRKGAGGIRIEIDDSRAVYPVVIDPLLGSASWFLLSDQDGSEFGLALATAGDVNGDGYSDTIVGAPSYDNGQVDEGRAFLYNGSASGPNTTPDWQFESDQAAARLGFSVSTAGDVNGDGYSDIVVGCPACDSTGLVGGSAFVFLGSAAGLSSVPDWSGDGDQSAMEYGFAVAAAGDVNGDGRGDVLVGAPYRDVGGTDDGRAYLHYGSNSGIGAAVDTFDGTASDYWFGYDVAGVGDLNSDGFADIVFGVPGLDGIVLDEGGISIWLGTASGPLAHPILDPTNQSPAYFGWSVGAAGDVNGDGYADLAAGAPNYGADQGVVYVYMGNAGGVDIASPWIMVGEQADMHFGDSVATAGDVNGDGYADLVVGANDYTDGELEEGGAFVFLGSEGGLDSAPDWIGQSNLALADYGTAVATAGDVNGDGYSDVLVGAGNFRSGLLHVGAAYAYLGSAAGPSSASSWSAWGNSSFEQFGFSVASAGDVNGDGYADVIVGIPRYDAGAVDTGNAKVYLGSASGLSTAFAWDDSGSSQDDHFGQSVAGAGDVNGDGYSDVLVGIPDYDDGASFEVGRVQVYHGSSTGLSAVPDWVETGTQSFAHFGFSLASAGDVDGDGYFDVVIGEPYFDDFSALNAGRALVYPGTSAGLDSSPAWSDVGDLGGSFGFSVASAGDVNGDGMSDVIVGEPGPCSTCGTGEAFVYLGTSAGLAGTPIWTDDGGSVSVDNRFGWSVGTAGDVNGDGYSDIVVGNILDPSLNHVNLYFGSAGGPSTPADWSASGQSNTSQMGYTVGTAGDVNGDGLADVVAGEPSYAGAFNDEGSIHVWLGSNSGFGTGSSWQVTGSEAGAMLGFAVASAGDVDGDGYADLIAGAPGAHVVGVDTGRTYLFSGNGAEGTSVALLPRQMRYDDSGQVHRLGTADDPGAFRLRMFARTPFGRGLTRLESEVKPLGTPISGGGIATPPAFTDSGGASLVLLNEPQTGLAPDTLQHWRVRLDYESVSLPYAPAGRWLTMPWNGVQEADLRTAGGAVSGAGVVPDDPENQLRLGRDAAGMLLLGWGESCTASDDDFAVYAGTIGCFASHVAVTCSTAGANDYAVPPDPCQPALPWEPADCQPAEPVQSPDPCRSYYLVVPVDSTSGREGLYGTDSNGLPRSLGREICHPQAQPADCALAAP